MGAVTGSPLADRVKLGVIGSARSTEEVVDAVTQTIGELIPARRGGVGEPALAPEIARGVIRGARHVGGDIQSAAAGMVIGMLRGAAERGDEPLTALRATAGSLVHETAAAGGHLGGAAQGVVEGAISAARELGIDVRTAASAAAGAAVSAAASVNAAAGDEVTRTTTSVIAGVEVRATPPGRR